jgi:N6-adenosine-specific RNA methylase IME4
VSELQVLRSEETAEYWEARIRPHLGRAVEGIVAAGREFIEAKASVDHGEFGRLAELLGMDRTTVFRFMAVAGHAVTGNVAHAQHLPASWYALYELTKLQAPALEAAIESGEVTPAMERKAAVQLVARYRLEEGGAGRPIVEPVTGTFRVIAADPPWRYDNRATRAAAEDHYPTLSIEQLKGLDVDGRSVEECAADGCHLYLWTTNSFLREAFGILDAWGFAYKTCLTWVKPQLGIGNYFRSMTEHVLFGVRGNLRRLDGNQPNWFQAARGQHSRKPDCFYELVERVSPGPYLELFGRLDMLGPREGWTVWGNEA